MSKLETIVKFEYRICRPRCGFGFASNFQNRVWDVDTDL